MCRNQTQNQKKRWSEIVLTHTHTNAHTHRKIKEVGRRFLLARVIKNSVNEAALSPQIEQMILRQQCGNFPHKSRESVEGRRLRAICICICARKVFCKHLILHNECSPLSSTRKADARSRSGIEHRGASFTCHAGSPPLSSHKSQSVCTRVCVCVSQKADM